MSKKINIEAKRIKVIKDWPKPKSVRNIQVFLGFANFYWQFIQSFNRITIPLTSILKITRSSNKAAPSKNNGSKSASNRKNNSKPVFEKNNSNSEVDRFDISRNGIKQAKKSRKLSKSKKSKSEKMLKS